MMTTLEAIHEMNKLAIAKGFKITQSVVWGNFSDRIEKDLRCQDAMRTYENEQGEKLTLCYNAVTDEIY